MKSRVWKAFPRPKTIVIVLALGLLFGFLMKGNDPQLFLGLLMAVMVLGLIWIRNYDPDTFEAHSDPVAYHRRKVAEELFGALNELTLAVEEDYPSRIQEAAAKAREVLNKYKGARI